MGFLSGLFGKKNGLYETYHENGQLQFRGIYVAGKPDGPFESYYENCLLYTSPSPRDRTRSRMPSSA